MPLVTTPGADDATSYSSRADAIVRAALDVRGTSFAAEEGGVQDQLLAMATVDIDSALLGTGRLIGVRASSTQSLELPRAGSDTLPKGLVLATQLLAFHYAERKSVGEIGVARADKSNLKEDTIGPITKVYFERSATSIYGIDLLPAHVRGHLTALLLSLTATYGTGTVVRNS